MLDLQDYVRTNAADLCGVPALTGQSRPDDPTLPLSYRSPRATTSDLGEYTSGGLDAVHAYDVSESCSVFVGHACKKIIGLVIEPIGL